MNVEVVKYCSKWKQLLQFEHKAQTNILNNRLLNMPAKELQKHGYCVQNVKAQIKGIFYGDSIARLSLNDNQMFPINHQFMDGNEIILSRNNPLLSGALKGSVLERNKRFIDVVLYQMDTYNNNLSNGVWRMDVGVDEQTINRMQYALDNFNDEMAYNGSKLLQKMISKNYNDYTSLMMINQEEILKYNHTYYQQKQQQKQQKQHLKIPEISEFKMVLTEQLLTNINNHLSDIRDKDSSLFKELEIEIEEICNKSELLSLNESQLNAVKASFENALCLIQGPPGTGKTKTAAEIIYIAAKIQQLTEKYYNNLTHRKRKNLFIRKPILVTSATNAGVDNLLSELLQKQLNIVRVGLPVRINSNVRSLCLPFHIENHCRKNEIIKIEKRIIEINEELGIIRSKQINLTTTTPAIRRVYKNRKQNLFKEKQELILKKATIHNAIITDILSSADVVCATCIGCGNDAFLNAKSLQFALIIVDEASQCIEPAVLIPLTHSCSNHGKLVLIGDQKQLPPLIMSQEAKQNGLDITLFDRLIDAFNESKFLSHIPLFSNNLLSMQYRMHPHIAQWTNSVVYDNKIKNAISAMNLDAFHIPGFQWPSKKIYDDVKNKNKNKNFFFEHNSPLIFIDVKGKEYKRNSDHSVNNRDEANIIIKLLRNIIEVNQDNKDLNEILKSIGIITGYNAQVSLITDKLIEIYGGNNDILDCIDIESVDGFQGREKDLIIFSSVRSNKQNNIGFMKDDRRLNVALTRARRGLIVIGNADTLCKGDKLWNNFIGFMKKSGRIVSETNINQYLHKRFDDIQETQNVSNFYIESLDQHTVIREHVIEAIVT